MDCSPKKLMRGAAITAVGLLAPSAALAFVECGRNAGIGVFFLAMIMIDTIMCLFLGLACMLTGFGLAIARRQWHQPRPLIGFGAALGVIVFTVWALVGHAHPHTNREC